MLERRCFGESNSTLEVCITQKIGTENEGLRHDQLEHFVAIRIHCVNGLNEEGDIVRALNALQLAPHCSKGVGLSSAHRVVSHCFDCHSFEASGVPLLAGKRQALPFPHLVAAVEAMLLVLITQRKASRLCSLAAAAADLLVMQ